MRKYAPIACLALIIIALFLFYHKHSQTPATNTAKKPSKPLTGRSFRFVGNRGGGAETKVSGPFLPVALESDSTLEIRDISQSVGGGKLDPMDAELFGNASHGEVLMETFRVGEMKGMLLYIDFGDAATAKKALESARKAEFPPGMYLSSSNQIVIFCLSVKPEDQAAVTRVVAERFRAKGIN